MAGGVLIANGLHKDGDNGMLFEEWGGEHSYLRRRDGCDDVTSQLGCDMSILRDFSADPTHVALVHSYEPADATGQMTPRGVLKLAAFLWAAGPSAFYADVPPLKGESAHWQCDEWAAMPRFPELAKALGAPTGPGTQAHGVYRRAFASGAHVSVETRNSTACIVWGDASTSGACA